MERKYVITAGDVAGCSPLLLEALAEHRRKDETFVVVGPSVLRGDLLDRLNVSKLKGIEWLEVGNLTAETIASGAPSASTGDVAYRCLTEAMKLSSAQMIRGILTLPLSKATVQDAGHEEFVGHTERLEEFFGAEGVMTFFGESLSVALLTRHLPLCDVPSYLTENRIKETVKTVYDFLTRRGNSDPDFAVLGLNPHAGEDGRLGSEERDVIRPALRELRSEGISIEGPVPADSFVPVHAESVELVFACYHDQGLIPFKQLHFFDGVHATLGLPVPRVSPDHGIAADRVTTGNIDTRSVVHCLEWLRKTSEQ